MARIRNVSLCGLSVLLCTFVTSFAQAAAPDTTPTASQVSPSAAEITQLAQQHVNERLGYWQQRLKLGDWRISVSPARRSELKPNTLGAIHWDKSKKTATIWVLDAADYQLPFRGMLDDLEVTIVHELIHLELTSLPRGEASRASEEHAVNGIADALLTLDRGKQ